MITNLELFEQYYLFRQNIKKIRMQKQLTQEQLAELSDLSTSYIKQIESGKEFKNISLITMVKLSKALDSSINRLFYEE